MTRGNQRELAVSIPPEMVESMLHSYVISGVFVEEEGVARHVLLETRRLWFRWTMTRLMTWLRGLMKNVPSVDIPMKSLTFSGIK